MIDEGHNMSLPNLLNDLKDPIKEMGLIRRGVETVVIEAFLANENISVKDVLERLNIAQSTYYSKKSSQQPLDSYTTEKFIRLISVLNVAVDILGKAEAKSWIYKNIPALGNEVPINLLDTEVGHRLVEQALLQIKYGMYA